MPTKSAMSMHFHATVNIVKKEKTNISSVYILVPL